MNLCPGFGSPLTGRQAQESALATDQNEGILPILMVQGGVLNLMMSA
jgi:hypothetical protein